MDDKDWALLVDQLKNGDCTPLVGPWVSGERAPTHVRDAYAAPRGPSFLNRDESGGDVTYPTIADRRSPFLRERIAHDLLAVPPPDFNDPREPHALLASLPLPVYLTTNFDGFLVTALHNAGRAAARDVCPWYPGAIRPGPDDSAYLFPTSDEPLVYHLHGSIEDPRSLVVTEEDHLEFLLGLAMDRGSDDQRIIPTRVLPALTTRPLLFMGYDLSDWTFRFLFHGLLRTVAAVAPGRHVSLQLPPPAGRDDAAGRAQAERYLADYFGHWNVSVFWGTTAQFCGELDERLTGQRRRDDGFPAPDGGT
ncbi:MAG: SIR2 family NAD-dependent protein deacylase [Frankia sp.]